MVPRWAILDEMVHELGSLRATMEAEDTRPDLADAERHRRAARIAGARGGHHPPGHRRRRPGMVSPGEHRRAHRGGAGGPRRGSRAATRSAMLAFSSKPRMAAHRASSSRRVCSDIMVAGGERVPHVAAELDGVLRQLPQRAVALGQVIVERDPILSRTCSSSVCLSVMSASAWRASGTGGGGDTDFSLTSRPSRDPIPDTGRQWSTGTFWSALAGIDG